jgi:hypothetical protein
MPPLPTPVLESSVGAYFALFVCFRLFHQVGAGAMGRWNSPWSTEHYPAQGQTKAALENVH